jgi:chromosome segregation ATPase
MQNHIHRTSQHLALTAVLALVLCYLPACTSTGYQKGDIAAVNMQKAATEVQAESRALNQTLASLRDLENEPSGDLRVSFKRYSQSIDRLIATAQRTESTGKRMEQKSAAYFEAWDRQLPAIDYQHIRDLSDARRTEVTNRVDALNRRYQESQAAVQPLISYFQDIRKALAADLTVGGLESLKDVVQHATGNVAKVQIALDALATDLTNSSSRMSSIGYQTAPQNSP